MINKDQKIQFLKQDLIKYSKQIGILDMEIPELIVYADEFKTKEDEAYKINGRENGLWASHYAEVLGQCSSAGRHIFVNIDGNWNGHIPTLIELEFTLVHELCHYRFGFRYPSHRKK